MKIPEMGEGRHQCPRLRRSHWLVVSHEQHSQQDLTEDYLFPFNLFFRLQEVRRKSPLPELQVSELGRRQPWGHGCFRSAASCPVPMFGCGSCSNGFLGDCSQKVLGATLLEEIRSPKQ